MQRTIFVMANKSYPISKDNDLNKIFSQWQMIRAGSQSLAGLIVGLARFLGYVDVNRNSLLVVIFTSSFLPPRCRG